MFRWVVVQPTTMFSNDKSTDIGITFLLFAMKTISHVTSHVFAGWVLVEKNAT